MPYIAVCYQEDQHAPSEPERKLYDVTPDNVEEVASKIGLSNGLFDDNDGPLNLTYGDSNYGDFQVSDGEGSYVIFTELAE